MCMYRKNYIKMTVLESLKINLLLIQFVCLALLSNDASTFVGYLKAKQSL